LYQQKRPAEAEPLYARSLAIWSVALGDEHPLLAGSYDNLAASLAAQEKYAEAEQHYRKALAIRELHAVRSVDNIGLVLDAQEKFRDAEALYKGSLPLLERLNDPKILRHYATVLRKLKKNYAASLIEKKLPPEEKQTP
jgi:tetratricopeptide (TPR) repeat protein